MSTDSLSVNDLFSNAVADGTITPASLNVIKNANFGAQIQNNLGISVQNVTSSDPFLVTLLIDDSMSIRQGGNEALIRAGHNHFLESLRGAKQDDGIIISCFYMNSDQPFYEFRSIDNAIEMNAQNYKATGATPLYDKTIMACSYMLAKQQEFMNTMNVLPRTLTMIITDGADWGSNRSIREVSQIVSDMIRREFNIVAGMGISDGSTDFNDVFARMGIPQNWILTPQNNAHSIREAFDMASKSAVQLSRAAGASFSQQSLGGFSVEI